MSLDANKRLAARFYDFFNSGDLAVADQLFTPNYVNHEATAPNGGWPQGPEGPKAIVSMYRTAIPNIQFTIEVQFADADKVVTRWTARGTHTGPLMGIPATGKSATISGTSIERISDNKIAETWVNFDLLGLLTQFGVIPN